MLLPARLASKVRFRCSIGLGRHCTLFLLLRESFPARSVFRMIDHLNGKHHTLTGLLVTALLRPSQAETENLKKDLLPYCPYKYSFFQSDLLLHSA